MKLLNIEINDAYRKQGAPPAPKQNVSKEAYGQDRSAQQACPDNT